MFVLTFAAAFAASAQSQSPFSTVSIPAAPAKGNVVELSDLSHKSVHLVYPDSIFTVYTDGTTSSYALPEKAVSYTGTCISSNGIIATSEPDPTAGNLVSSAASDVLVVDLVGASSKILKLKFATDGAPNSCAFSKDGLLYLGADFVNGNFRNTIPGIIIVDPATMQVVRTVMTGEINDIKSMVATPIGVYVLSQEKSPICMAKSNCDSSIGMVGSDGAYKSLFRTTMAWASSGMTLAPNGYLLVDGKTFDQNGQPATALTGLGLYTSVSFPSTDPGYAYKTYLGFFGGVDIASNSVAVNLASTSSQYLSVAAERQPDGTDLVIALRDGFVDFFSITPPQVMSSVANAGSRIQGPLAPGSIISIFGQALGSWGQSDSADGTKVLTQIGNTKVFVDGNIAHPIRLLYVGYGQVNAILPSNLSVGVRHWLTVKNGSASITQDITIADQSLAAFMWAPDPANQSALAPILTDASYRLIGNASLSPAYAQANPGDTLILWATGGGRTSPTLDDSIFAVPTDSLFHLALLPQVLVDGKPSIVTYA
jgi:uncharacterized protein (TIGR03437 family)